MKCFVSFALIILSGVSYPYKFTYADSGFFFPIEKNGSQALPQRFEYRLIDQDTFQIGDVLIDTRKMNLQLQLTDPDHLQARFDWPSGLLKKGDIVIKDDIGRALWSKHIDTNLIINEKQTIISKSSIQNKTSTLRADIASYKIDNIDPNLITKIKSYPFFKFCLQNKEGPTKVFLCSKDLYLKKNSKKIYIQQRDSIRSESYVEINGQKVSNQGLVFLQSKFNPIFMRALIRSGATVEINTRLKSIDLKDIYQTDDKKIMIKASGAAPAREDLVYSQDGSDWTMQVNPNRPIIYLLGEAGIPLRQEFILGKYIRPESLNIPIRNKSDLSTYDPTVTLQLNVPRGISLNEVSPNAKPQKIGDTQWDWKLAGLQTKQNNRRFVQITKDQAKYIGAIDIHRGESYELTSYLLIYPLWLDINFKQWLNANYGWDIGYKLFVQKNSNEPDFSAISVQLRYRLTPGLYLQTLSHELLMSFDSYSINGTSSAALGIGGQLMYNTPSTWNSYFDWIIVRIKVPILSLASNPAVKGDYLSDFILKKRYNAWTWELGLRAESDSFSTKPNDTTISRFSLLTGASFIFY